MPTLVSYSGEDEIYKVRSSYVNVYGPPCKRLRIRAPFERWSPKSEQQTTPPPINLLPDECLFEILRCLPSQERSVAACVSKHWLALLSSTRRSEVCLDSAKDSEVDDPLTRSLEGKRATDIRLAAMAVGTAPRGGLGKLSIRGSNSARGVTDLGLSAIARGCPSLRSLSLWNLPCVGVEGLVEISKECHLLERLDLCQCPSITSVGLIAIARHCPNLTHLSVESCPNIGNDGIQAISRGCPKLESVSIKDCPLVGDQGIASLLSPSSSVLSKVKLQSLNISDFSLAVIGHYGKSVTNLTLTSLRNVSERGFWVMGNARGLASLASLTIASCFGVTDLSLEAVTKGCSGLKQLSLNNCCFISDNGLTALSSLALSLESLHLEDCSRVTLSGVTYALSSFSSKFRSLSLVKCLNFKDTPFEPTPENRCMSLRSLSIRHCPGFGTSSLAILGTMCPNLNQVDLSGLYGMTDDGILSLVNGSLSGLVKLNLSGCINLSDESVLAVARAHGETIKMLSLNRCRKITDTSLLAISESCSLLNDLDISNCAITDSGIAALSSSELNLQILSISGCSKISNKSLPFLIQLGQNLVGLNLKHCTSLTTNSIDKLIDNLWRCDILH